jgi:site-specific DNA-methyltransferase (adenine-specific)
MTADVVDIHGPIEPHPDLDPLAPLPHERRRKREPFELVEGRGWTMVRGDCVAWLRAQVVAGKRFDHVITDPPYEAEAHTKQRRLRNPADGKGVEVKPIAFAAISAQQRTAAACFSALLVKRWAIFFCQVEGAPKWQAAGEMFGLVHKRVAIWEKPDGSPQFSGDRPAQGYEAIEIMHAPGRSRWNGGGKRGIYVHSCRDASRGNEVEHDTPKPIAIMIELVRDFTSPDDVILDPFAGSCATGIAALRLGRRFVGVERSRKSFELSCEALRAEQNNLSVQAQRAKQIPLFGGDS